MVLSATRSEVFLASGALLAEGADLASAGLLAVAVALGSAVGAVSPTLPMMPPRLSAAADDVVATRKTSQRVQ